MKYAVALAATLHIAPISDFNMPKPTRRFHRGQRIRTSLEYSHVYRNGVVVADDVLVIRASLAPSDCARLGLTVSRKVGNAVVRNGWKRRIREAFRLIQHDLPSLDLVVRPRKGAVLDYHAIARSLPALARRLSRKLKQH